MRKYHGALRTLRLRRHEPSMQLRPVAGFEIHIVVFETPTRRSGRLITGRKIEQRIRVFMTKKPFRNIVRLDIRMLKKFLDLLSADRRWRSILGLRIQARYSRDHCANSQIFHTRVINHVP